MGAYRSLIGFVCAALLAGCVEQSDKGVDSEDLDLALQPASGPNLPPPPAGATCALIERGVLGAVQDSDIGYGNGPNYNMGSYNFSWTGPSPYDHWSAYQFDISVVPANSSVVLAVFSNYVSWNMESSTVRAHRIKNAWSEGSVTWNNFGGNSAWDSAVLGSFDGSGVGYHSIEVTALTQSWHTGAVANNGILLEEDPVKLHNYFSSENSAGVRPNLWVCWVEGAVGSGSGGAGGAGSGGNGGSGLGLGSGEGGGATTGSGSGGAGSGGNGGSGLGLGSGEGGGSSSVSGSGGGVILSGAGGGATTGSGGAGSGGNGGSGLGLGSGEGGGSGGGVCSDVGAACASDASCCGGSCFDGMCVNLNACVSVDSGASCDPANPCCDGAHCIYGLCFNDVGLTCKAPGAACDENNDACCWNLNCLGGSCQ